MFIVDILEVDVLLHQVFNVAGHWQTSIEYAKVAYQHNFPLSGLHVLSNNIP